MRTSMAYLAGAGTVVVAIAAGLGGGLVIANVASPGTRELGRVELQMKARQASQQQDVAQQSPQPDATQASPSPSSATASNPPQVRAPYLAQVQPAANAPVVVGAAPPKSQEQPQDQPKTDATMAAPPAVKPGDAPKAKREDAKRDDTPKVKQAEQTQPKPAEQAQVQPATHDDVSAPENAYAKARDADLKRQDDRRKLDRRQWASRRQQRDPDMRDVEEEVRRDSGPREIIVRRDDSDRPDFDRNDRRDYDRPDYDRGDDRRPAGFGFPHINIFAPDD
jgi:hypothetical protein